MLDKSRRELTTPDGVAIDLTGGDFDLLVAFVENPNRILTRDQLYDITRGRSAPPLDRSIDVHVSRLRRKLEHCAGGHDIIKTVRGSGYVFAAIVEPSISNMGYALLAISAGTEAVVAARRDVFRSV